jgi:hypothetical protein
VKETVAYFDGKVSAKLLGPARPKQLIYNSTPR